VVVLMICEAAAPGLAEAREVLGDEGEDEGIARSRVERRT
jgi:hypothetical protein